tara:strand:+ start:662 stop:1588 length:927 start_codon:yes stop_codon:yes gene_type:complete
MATEKILNGYYLYRPAAWISASDEDASGFLQSQFSNDLSGLRVGEVKYGLWLDQKGKVHGDSFILRSDEEEHFLMSYATNEASLLEKLNRFIVADDVELEGLADQHWGILLLGDGLKFVKNFELGNDGSAILSIENETVYCFPGRRCQQPSMELICRSEALPILETSVVDSCPGIYALSEATVEGLRVYSGFPKVPIDIGPTELPQEGGLEKDGVSFNKGCYLGQEVMSRLQSMGQVRRSLRVVVSDQVLEFGAPIYCENKKVGVVKSSISENGRTAGLALISNSTFEGSALCVGEPGSGILLNLVPS